MCRVRIVHCVTSLLKHRLVDPGVVLDVSQFSLLTTAIVNLLADTAIDPSLKTLVNFCFKVRARG